MMNRARGRSTVLLTAAAVVLAGLGLASPATAASTSAVSLRSSTTGAAYGQGITLSGTVRSASAPVAAAVTVESRDLASTGSWHAVAAVESTATGTWSTSLQALKGGQFRARAVVGSATVASAVVRVQVQPQLYDAAAAGTADVAVGAVREFTGRLHGGLAGKRVKVEQWTPTGWTFAGQSYAKTGGRVSIPVKVTRWGAGAYRMVVPSGDGLIVKASGVLRAGAYGAATAKLDDGKQCWGADAGATPTCDGSRWGDTISPKPAESEKDTQGAFSCYTSDVSVPVPSCRYGSSRADALRVAVTGDSHGAMLLSGLKATASTLNWRVDSFVGRGCVLASTSAGDPCQKRRTDLAKRLAAGGYDVVVVTALRSDSVDPASFSAAWKPLIAKGTKVIAVADDPMQSEAAISCAVGSKTASTATKCATTKSSAFAVQDPLRAAVASTPGAVLIDQTGRMCDAARCPVVIGHVMAYRDRHHMSATFVRTLVPYLVQEMAGSL
ncbi:SGNH hydrolase domain-containing protein [Curtobacterium sp. KT1]|uniref:SGNH hydrolase domain-containing protein n=1 Tax=Curtobacterium sp. KT1 TaxID=3372858 RepID=UPI0037C0B2E1